MKRTKYLTSLSHDHHHGLQAAVHLKRELAENSPSDELAGYVSKLWREDLAPHFADEEALLVPLMDAPGLSELAGQMLEEHRVIRGLIDEIESDAQARKQHMLRLSEALTAHIRFEERQVFPAIEANAPESALREVAEKLAARG